ncbi:MAG: MFS transporter [Microvirga sp.]
MSHPFRCLLAAFLISSVGDWLYKLALPLLILQLTGSAFDASLAYGLTFLPYVVVSIFGGVIADRFDRRSNLILGDLTSTFGMLAIYAASRFGAAVTVILVLSFVTACITPLYHPSFQSIIPELVEREKLARANAMVGAVENTMMVFGPFLGGAALLLLKPNDAILLNAGTFLLSAVFLLLIRTRHLSQRKKSERTILQDMAEGFAYLWQNPILRYGAFMFFGTNFAIHFFYGSYVYYLSTVLGASNGTIGLSIALSGVGAVAGSLAAPRLIARFDSGRIIVLSTVVAGFVTLPLLWIDDPVLIGANWGVVMVFSWINVVTYFTLRQKLVPNHLLGRAVAATRLIAYSSIPLGSALGGYLIETAGVVPLILVCASLRTAIGILAAFTPLGRGIDPVPGTAAPAV